MAASLNVLIGHTLQDQFLYKSIYEKKKQQKKQQKTKQDKKLDHSQILTYITTQWLYCDD